MHELPCYHPAPPSSSPRLLLNTPLAMCVVASLVSSRMMPSPPAGKPSSSHSIPTGDWSLAAACAGSGRGSVRPRVHRGPRGGGRGGSTSLGAPTAGCPGGAAPGGGRCHGDSSSSSCGDISREGGGDAGLPVLHHGF